MKNVSSSFSTIGHTTARSFEFLQPWIWHSPASTICEHILSVFRSCCLIMLVKNTFQNNKWMTRLYTFGVIMWSWLGLSVWKWQFQIRNSSRIEIIYFCKFIRRKFDLILIFEHFYCFGGESFKFDNQNEKQVLCRIKSQHLKFLQRFCL